jgi:hypothetical protein
VVAVVAVLGKVVSVGEGGSGWTMVMAEGRPRMLNTEAVAEGGGATGARGPSPLRRMPPPERGNSTPEKLERGIGDAIGV